MIVLNGETVKYVEGHTIEDYIGGAPLPLCAAANNALCDLRYIPRKGEEITLKYLTDTYAFACLRNTLFLIFATAVSMVDETAAVHIRRSIGKATYCDISSERSVDDAFVQQISQKMKELIGAKLKITKTLAEPDTESECLPRDNINLYSIYDKQFHICGIVATNTCVIDSFLVTTCENGFLLQYPNHKSEGKIPELVDLSRLSASIGQVSMWSDVLDIHTVSDLNCLVKGMDTRDMLLMQEGLHEKNVAQIADAIASDPGKKVVLITGPSSSGKTSFSRKLNVHLKINGLTPVVISLDDYFMDIEFSLRHEDGSFNFEELESIDYKLFNRHIAALIGGEEVEIPRFSFGVARRMKEGRKLRLKEGQILVVEGIHALNERLTPSVREEQKFKIYCSPLSNINISNLTYLSPTDLRLVRRLVRDFNFRYSSAQNTFDMWPSVKKGENKNIFPYEKHANVIFNSSIIYEMCVFRQHLEPMLRGIQKSSDKYPLAQRLMETASYFEPMDDSKVPSTSILREFIGGSAYFKK